jgi:hypothetical protein
MIVILVFLACKNSINVLVSALLDLICSFASIKGRQMAAPNISIQLFDLTSPTGRDLAALLRRVSHTAKNLRWRRLNQNTEVALLECRQEAGRNLFLLDFVKRRYVGPGKVKSDSELASFQFDANETFGEETSALIDLERGWLVVQYNHHGVRAASIAEYLSAFENDPESDWLVNAVLDPQVMARLRRKGNIRAAQFTVKLSNDVSAAMRDEGEALGSALDQAGRASEAAVMSLELKMSRSDGFLTRSVRSLMQRLASIDSDDIKSLKITAREGDVGNDEVIDLLRHKIKTRYSSEDLQVEGGRYTLDSRWRALMRIHAGWSQNH